MAKLHKLQSQDKSCHSHEAEMRSSVIEFPRRAFVLSSNVSQTGFFALFQAEHTDNVDWLTRGANI